MGQTALAEFANLLVGSSFAGTKLYPGHDFLAVVFVRNTKNRYYGNLGITIYKTKDSKETAMFLYQLAKKEQIETKTTPKLRFEKAPIEMSHLLEYVIAGIPGVNALRAKNLLKELKTLQSIVNADIGDLMKVENVAARIKYDSPEETPSVDFNTGIRNELMPNANPIAKNIIPTKARGMIKFFFSVILV